MTATAMQLDIFTRQPRPGECSLIGVRREEAESAEPSRRRAALDHNAETFRGRKALILDAIRICGKPMTDRQIKERLFGEGADMNTVRPRINELLQERKLMLAAETYDHVTGERVRAVWLA